MSTNNTTEEQISAAGERAAMGGYVPQFNEFASLAYRELTHGNLEWIKIADPEAEKLDDIQYATAREVHAYQVKWTIAGERISYLNFTSLLPLIISSWQSLRSINAPLGKEVIGHLLTNKQLSLHDSIETAGTKLGTFSDFYQEVWTRWKANRPIDSKWNDTIDQLVTLTGLTSIAFFEFVAHFEFHPAHPGRDMNVSYANTSPQTKDLLDFRSFLLQNVADPSRQVAFSKEEIIRGLGWESKFRTTFNHELFVDKKRYQAIHATVQELNANMTLHTGGYLFLVGGPGTGKSTMLTEWVKQRPERIVKYYAFDFSNPSAFTNSDERGDATNLYFDLVFQLKAEGFYQKPLLPYRDLLFLKSVFREQLSQLGDDYKSTGRGTIIIIDGLDHVPREYKTATKSFLRELPLPSDLPEGVYVVLGSQTYDFEDLSQEIKNEWRQNERTIVMSAMERKEVFSYIAASELDPQLNLEQQQLLFEKSQGHPLYLSYLLEKLRQSENRESILDEAAVIDGNIGLYYQKIWAPIHNNAGLLRLLGLIAWVNGSPTLDFIREWPLDQQTLIDFRNNARLLFAESRTELTFFHNSFRQFLLSETAIDILDNSYDRKKDVNYHKDLAVFYETSSAEPHWKKNYHLYSAEAFDNFVAATTPEAFLEQLTDFRPTWEIRRDIKLGIEVARKRHDLILLLRYLFALAELDRRVFNADPAAFIEELLYLEQFEVVKAYIRNGATLLINDKAALMAARQLAELGRAEEALLVYSLAEPDMIEADAVVVDYNKPIERSTFELLQQWIYTGLLLQGFDSIFSKIRNTTIINLPSGRPPIIPPSKLKASLISYLCYALISYGEWEKLQQMTEEWDLAAEDAPGDLFYILRYAVEASLRENEVIRASALLGKMLSLFNLAETGNEERIYIADLVLAVDQRSELAEKWLNDVPQPFFTSTIEMDITPDFDDFLPLIKYNTVLNLLGKGVKITDAVPGSSFSADNAIFAEFQQMICLITQVLCDGLENKGIINLENRIRPIVQFFNRNMPANNSDWNRLTRLKGGYSDFLIDAVAQSGHEQLEELAGYLSKDFTTHAAYWTAGQKRGVITALVNNGYKSEKAKPLLHSLEETMLDGHDIDGRVSECSAHAKVWILLEEKDIAKQWIKRSLWESIGIGYRKDYQYNAWIDWLKTTICISPATAVGNIQWFLSHLRHIRESTEGNAYWSAANKLLETTLNWNFEAGTRQLKWQLDGGYIEFEGALSTFLACYTDSSPTLPDYQAAISVYAEIHLLIAAENDYTLLEKLLSKGYALSGEDFFPTDLQIIYKTVQTNALDEHREGLLRTIDDFLRAKDKVPADLIPGFPTLMSAGGNQDDDNTLIINPGRIRMAEAEVLKRVTDYGTLKNLLDREDRQNSFFDWDKVVQQLLPKIGVHQMEEIMEIIEDQRRPTNMLILLSKHAQALGQPALAETLLNKSIKHSSERGWIEFYDGGSRIKPFKALYKLMGEPAAKQAFEFFSHDLMMGEMAITYAENLSEILPVISPGYDEGLIWEQVFNYLKRLMSTSKPIEDLPDISPGEKSIRQCLTDLMLYLARYNVPVVARPAQRILSRQLSTGDEYTADLIAALPIDTGADSELFTGLLSLADACGAALDRHLPKLKALAVSDNFIIRQEAQRLLAGSGTQAPVIGPKQLPAYYASAVVGDSLSEIQNMIRPFSRELETLSELTGLDEQLLSYRVYNFMKDAEDLTSLSPESEIGFRQHLEQIRLRYSFMRPRVLAARRAVAKLIAELYDADMLTGHGVEMALNWARMVDGGTEFVFNHGRPAFIARLAKPGEMLNVQDWTDNLEAHPRPKEGMIQTIGEMYVVGEYTLLRSLNWKTATEVYNSQITVEPKDPDDGLIFSSAFNRLSENYYQYNGLGNSIIIVRDNNFGQFDVQSTFLAINPVLARHLQWTPQPWKMFAWEDENGHTLVESVFWRDGNANMPPPHLYSESGEGWYVLASEKAIEQIRAAAPALYFQKYLERSIPNEDKENSITQIDKLKI